MSEESKKHPSGSFSPPKGYGGFIPFIDDVHEGEWALGVSPTQPKSPPASGNNRSEATADRVGLASPARQEAEAKPSTRPLGEIPLQRPDSVGLHRPAAQPPPAQANARRVELGSPPPARSSAVSRPAAEAPGRRGTRKLWLLVALLALGLAAETWYSLRIVQQHDAHPSPVPEAQQATSAQPPQSAPPRPAAPDTKADITPSQPSESGSTGQAPSGQKAAPAVNSTAQESSAKMPNPTGAKAYSPAESAVTQPAVPPATNQKENAAPPNPRNEIASERSKTYPQAVSRATDLRRTGEDHQEATIPSRPVAHPRVDFQVAKNSARQIVPGILLRVTGTNVRAQRYDGYLWMMSAGRALWLSNVGVQQPIVFYPESGQRPDRIVVTRITSDSVVGYLLQPVMGAAAEGEGSSTGLQPSRLYAEFTPAGKKSP